MPPHAEQTAPKCMQDHHLPCCSAAWCCGVMMTCVRQTCTGDFQQVYALLHCTVQVSCCAKDAGVLGPGLQAGQLGW